jgi:perosamine synthetase
MQAALGEVQLDRLNGLVAAKVQHAKLFDKWLEPIPGVRTPVVANDRDHTYMLYSLIVEEGRNDVLEALLAAGIEARLYFPPAHRQPIFEGQERELPVTDWLGEHLLSVPFHAQMSSEDLSFVAESLVAALPTPIPRG